jgi:hypothetical protein
LSLSIVAGSEMSARRDAKASRLTLLFNLRFPRVTRDGFFAETAKI